MADRYDCHNRPRVTDSYPAQDGWIVNNSLIPFAETRLPKIVRVRDVMSTDCHYDRAGTDPKCAGCLRDPDFNEVKPT